MAATRVFNFGGFLFFIFFCVFFSGGFGEDRYGYL